jgi:magnesium-protoporphyrin O-methyltransferase
MSYEQTRLRLETYFDRTAAETWARLTSDAPVSRIRATVRAGRDRMRDRLLSRLPADMSGQTLLDAGCGTGALAVEAARRGATVTAVDIAGNLLDVARDRLPADLSPRIRFVAGDMLDPGHGSFDWVAAMDSLIHYRAPDIAATLAALAARTRQGIVFTVAPATTALQAMHLVGKAFPRSDRSPAIVPVSAARLAAELAPRTDWRLAPVERVTSGFYISEALELLPR